ncbi:PLDc N-terminal domain-containing protein [Corynebacterium sp. UBA2622]|uniref:PLDc N-terminal domain-containing protein n=1 Tax=Corynebacterium sp. UBA2622 TaxID=1946393 RepID=UPI0025C540C1|nr:PLDc N-terminal domain-containing protein [Corynebacterium sp. UBA2622]
MATKTNGIIGKLSRSWGRVGKRERVLISILAAVDTAGKSAAMASLARTPKEKVRGPKLVWTPIIASVNTLGWLAWFLVGRKK